jgi:hypothetical protein
MNGGSAVIHPDTPDTPYDSTNSVMAGMTGYDRPLGWFAFLSTKPPTTVIAYTRNGDLDADRVWGPSPELNSLALLLTTLLPAGVLFRRRKR